MSDEELAAELQQLYAHIAMSIPPGSRTGEAYNYYRKASSEPIDSDSMDLRILRSVWEDLYARGFDRIRYSRTRGDLVAMYGNTEFCLPTMLVANHGEVTAFKVIMTSTLDESYSLLGQWSESRANAIKVAPDMSDITTRILRGRI